MQIDLPSDFEKKKQFLLAHEEFFLNGISLLFYLSHQQLTKYKSILPWGYIVSNHTIKWNAEMVEEFKNEIFIEDDFLNGINSNDSMPWSIEFIERYENVWNWELLAQNDNVMGNPEIRNHFYNRLYPYFEEHGKDIFNEKNQPKDISEYFINNCERDLNFFGNIKEWQFQTVDEIIKAKNIDWLRLSQNSLLPWSAELIEKFIDKWDWSRLGTNESIPWSLKLMKQFEDRIDWTIDLPDSDGGTVISGKGISANLSIEWDSEILSTFITKLNKWDISISEFAKWDIDLLIQFSDFWEYFYLSLNKIVWRNVFSEFNNEDYLNPLLNIILEKRKDAKN